MDIETFERLVGIIYKALEEQAIHQSSLQPSSTFEAEGTWSTIGDDGATLFYIKTPGIEIIQCTMVNGAMGTMTFYVVVEKWHMKAEKGIHKANFQSGDFTPEAQRHCQSIFDFVREKSHKRIQE